MSDNQEDRPLTRKVSELMKRHTTTVRFPKDRWEEMRRNAAFMGIPMNAYVNIAVENQNAKHRKQRRDDLQSQGESRVEEG